MPRILLIDDEPVICDVLAECLRELPETDVHCARGGIVGAEKLQNGRFDLALIDCRMPEIPGLKLAVIAANENIPVLFISGDIEANATLERLRLPYLSKPFALDQLLSASKRVIAEAKANIELIKASASRMLATGEALQEVISEARRRVDMSKSNCDE